MIIKSIRFTSFGSMSGKTVTFSDGLNILEGGNESGKSTSADLIRFVFYGLSTDEKQRFIPFGGDTLSGSVTVIKDGREYTAERIVSTRTTVSVTENGTKIDIGKKSPGEYLTGIPSADLFTSTVFSGCGGAVFPGSDKMLDAVENIITSGNEKYSAKKAGEALEKLRKTYTIRTGGGCVDILEKEISALKSEKSDCSGGEKQAEEYEKELEALNISLPLYDDKRREADNTEVEYLLSLQRIDDRALEAEKAEAERLFAELNASEKKYASNDRAPTYSDLTELSDLIKDRDEAEKDLATVITAKEESQEEKADAVAVLEELLKENAEEKAKILKKNSVLRLLYYPLLAVGIIGFGVTVLGMVLSKYAIIIAGILLFLCGFGAFFLTGSLMRKNGAELVTLDAAPEERGKVAQAEDKIAKYAEGEEAMRKHLAECGEKLDDFISSRNLPKDKPLEALRENIDSTRELNISYGVANSNFINHRIRITENPDRIADDGHEISLPEGYGKNTRAEALTMLRMSERRDSERKTELIGLIAKLRGGKKSPVEYDEEINEKTVQLEKKKSELAAIKAAEDALEKASEELRLSVSPKIAASAGKKMEIITGGKYGELPLDGQFGISFRPDGAGLRGSEFMSTGTRDAAYIALRLALCETVSAEPLPLILDETLNHLDPTRMAKCLELMGNEAENGRQIILFTVSDREKTLCEKNNIKASAVNF